MKNTIQISIDKLERIIAAAKRAREKDSSLSDVIEMEATCKTDLHTGSDMVGVIIKSMYGECDGESIYWR